MRTKATSSLTSRPSHSHSHQYRSKEIYHHHHGGDVVEEIEGLIRVHRDGHVERPQIVSCVPASPCPDPNHVTSTDIAIDNFTGTWARFYVPNTTISHQKLPLLIYFHGGGFCVGSASWVCYHEFLSKLSSKLNCLIMSLNYRLAPENPLPAAYEDGFKSLIWLKQQILLYQCTESSSHQWWIQKCNFSRIFVAGDSAGANIAYNVALNLSTTHEASSAIWPLEVKGMILIQPFFGGEARTASEKKMGKAPSSSALSLAASDTYWRLALPRGSNRDHQWCNPFGQGWVRLEELRLCPVLVCVSDLDILKDRNLELCGALVRAGKNVEHLVCKGVGHAFQILSKSQISQSQTHELIARIKSFVMAL